MACFSLVLQQGGNLTNALKTDQIDVVEGHMTALVIGKQLGLLLIDGPAAGGGGGVSKAPYLWMT